MIVRVASIIALAASCLGTPAAAAILQPSGQWTLDYGDTQCTAGRSFGDASSPVVLGIVPSLSGGTYRLLVSVERAGPAFAQQVPGTIDFGQGPSSSQLLYYGGKGVKLSVYQARLSAAQMEQARLAGTVTLRSHGAEYSLAVSDMPAILDGLRRCNSSLQQYWNLNRQPQVTAAASVAGDVRSLLTPADYPSQELGRQARPAAQFQLLVDRNGAVAACDVLVSSGSPAIDSAGCETIAQKARFNPARDASGASVRSVVTTPPLEWNSGAKNVFENGCQTLANDGLTLLSNCSPPRATPMLMPTMVQTETRTPPKKN